MAETETTAQLRNDGLAGRALLARLRHELRTPLNGVIGYSELLLEEEDSGEFNDSLSKMLAAGRELLALVNDLLSDEMFESKFPDQSAQSRTAVVRHQLRTSLTTVSGYCELLMEEFAEAGRDEVTPDLERIHRSAEKFLTLIDTVVDLAWTNDEDESIDWNAVSELEPLAQSENHAFQSPPGSLLVVDDNEINRDLLARRLEREGHQVAVATNGRQALEMIESGNYDLVLLDIIMPEMNGYQVLESLKSQGRLRDLPVLMLSALGDMESVVQCIRTGAEDYLSKPYDPVLLRARIGASLEKKRLRDRLREQLHAVERELDLAARIQKSILPSKFPSNPRLEIFAEMTPARAIGGDFYDFFQIDEERFGFAIADVSGKGAPAALFMALTRAFLKATATEGMSAGECMARVNRLVHAENQAGMFVTLFYGIINSRTGEIGFANAGHNHPYLLRSGESPAMLEHSNSLAIGILKNVDYPTHRLLLKPGDRLFLYTDGVTEAMTDEGEQFSEERLEEMLLRASEESLKETAHDVLKEMQRFTGGAAQSDDVTMVLVKYCG